MWNECDWHYFVHWIEFVATVFVAIERHWKIETLKIWQIWILSLRFFFHEEFLIKWTESGLIFSTGLPHTWCFHISVVSLLMMIKAKTRKALSVPKTFFILCGFNFSHGFYLVSDASGNFESISKKNIRWNHMNGLGNALHKTQNWY